MKSLIIDSLIIGSLIAFIMITLDVSGLKYKYDQYAERKGLKTSCDWCFSFWLSVISFLVTFAFFEIDSILVIPISTLIAFNIYRKSA